MIKAKSATHSTSLQINRTAIAKTTATTQTYLLEFQLKIAFTS